MLTDPPYFDNIAYSELADFFHPWLRHLGLISAPEIPGFPAAQLAAVSRCDAGAADAFKARLAACFREIARTMKPGAIGAFTYQHTTASGWLMLAQAMAASPLRVVNVFPMPGDTGANLHRKGESICWDAVLVLRTSSDCDCERPLLVSGNDVGDAERAVTQRSGQLHSVKGMPFRAADRLNLLRASLVAAALSPRPQDDGLPLGVVLATCALSGVRTAGWVEGDSAAPGPPAASCASDFL